MKGRRGRQRGLALVAAVCVAVAIPLFGGASATGHDTLYCQHEDRLTDNQEWLLAYQGHVTDPTGHYNIYDHYRQVVGNYYEFKHREFNRCSS